MTASANTTGAAAGQPRKRKKPSLRAKLLLLACAVLFIALALEVVLRVFYAQEVDTSLLRKRLANTQIGSFTQPAADPSLVYELRPHLDVKWMKTRVVTSADGACRIGPSDADPPDNAVRVAVIGDSTAFGWGVDQQQSYAALTVKAVGKATGAAIALRNFSVPGYNTLQELTCFRHKVLPWNPNLLIVHYDHNDADTAGMVPPNVIPPEYGDNVLHSALIKFIMRRLRAWRTSGNYTEGDPSSDSAVVFYQGYEVKGPHYDDHLDAFDKLKALAKEHDIPVVVVIFDADVDYVADLADDEHYQVLHVGIDQYLRGLGFHVLDLYPAYRQLIKQRGADALRQMHLSASDHHPNATGQRFIADQLTPFLLNEPSVISRLKQ